MRYVLFAAVLAAVVLLVLLTGEAHFLTDPDPGSLIVA